MDRRRFLAAVAGGTATGLAGCGTLSDDADGTPESATGGATDRSPGAIVTTPAAESAPISGSDTPDSEAPPGEHGYPPDICERAILDDPGIYAITDPAFGSDWTDVTVADYYVPPGATSTTEAGSLTGLGADQTVVGIATGDVARAYPVSVLRYHEIVNDDIGSVTGDTGGAVIVTYCPLCLSGVVAERVVDGTATTFAVTGQLWRPPDLQVRMAEADGRAFGARDTGGETLTVRPAGNLVMYDRATGSYWSQVTAEAICGPAAGTTLDVVPSTVATWADWRRDHPDTEVLLPPPYSTTTRESTPVPGTDRTPATR